MGANFTGYESIEIDYQFEGAKSCASIRVLAARNQYENHRWDSQRLVLYNDLQRAGEVVRPYFGCRTVCDMSEFDVR